MRGRLKPVHLAVLQALAKEHHSDRGNRNGPGAWLECLDRGMRDGTDEA
ncbi:MAG: hypothetical protein GY862_24305 [Gammaproteobacteria bacterium]|nr:hypothetical protein [Gammaproteobacteria bacterium]